MIAHIDLDSFFVAVERARRPDLGDRPIVIGGRPGSGGAVVAASREARRVGVRVGMALDEALLHCPDGLFVDGALDSYFAAAVPVDAVLRRESREIEWRSIDEAYVALSASSSQADAVAAIDRMQSGIRALGFDAACGLARNKLVARVASRLAHPRGVVHVLDGYERRFLAPLKIDMLPDVDPALIRRLRAAGVRRLGQIVAMAEADLARLGGRGAASLGRLAQGLDSSRITRSALPPGRLAEHELPAATSNLATVHRAVRHEAERLGRDLRTRGVYARTLTVRLRFADGGSESRTLPLPQPSMLDDALFTGAVELLARAWAGTRLVRAVSLSAASTVSAPSEVRLFA